MKRLIKKNSIEDPTEEFNVKDALIDLIYNNEGNEIVNLINNTEIDNSDCLYNGKVYRKLFFDVSFINSLSSYFEDDFGEYFDGDELISKIKEMIQTNIYQSFSKSLDACEDLTVDELGVVVRGDELLPVIIQMDCKNGIDVMKLTKKYAEIFKDYSHEDPDKYDCKTFRLFSEKLNETIKDFENEQEIYAMLDSYEFLSVGGLSADEFEGTTLNLANLDLEW